MLNDRHDNNALVNQLLFALLAGLLLFAPLARGGAPGWSVAMIGLVVVTAAAIALGAAILRWQPVVIRTGLERPILALTGLLLLSALLAVDRRAALAALTRFAAYLTVYFLAFILVKERAHRRRLAVWISGVSALVAAFALVKGGGLNPFPWWDYPDLSYPKEFLASTFGNHNHLAGWLEMAIPLLLVGLFRADRRGWLAITIPVLVLLVTVLVLSQSRGGWLGFLAGLLFLGGVLTLGGGRRTRRRWVLALLGGIGLLMVAVVLLSPATTERALTAEAGVAESSLGERIEVWRGVVTMIKAHPLLGTGPGTFKLAFPGYQPPGFSHRWDKAHNDYLEFTAELGLGFPVLLAWLLFLLYRQGLRQYRATDGYSALLILGALTGITSILVHSLVDFNLQLPANALLFTVLAAMAGKRTSGQAGKRTSGQATSWQAGKRQAGKRASDKLLSL